MTIANMTSPNPQPWTPFTRVARDHTFLNFCAGALAGSTGVLLTCPLDVVQTRLQSSLISLSPRAAQEQLILDKAKLGSNVLSYIRHVVRTEGISGLYKGLLPTLMGIAPSRAIYFTVYSKSKTFYGGYLASINPSFTHLCAALTASFCVSTITNPLWFLKTRLQLDLTARGSGTRTGYQKLVSIIRTTYRTDGIRGFYRGLSASYMGASETVIFFVLYEKLKVLLFEDQKQSGAMNTMIASFFAKTTATISVYPHEVVRTRLRQHQGRGVYNGFFQTLRKVYLEEGKAGLYGGMGAHLMRQVPNTVIMFTVFEAIIDACAVALETEPNPIQALDVEDF